MYAAIKMDPDREHTNYLDEIKSRSLPEETVAKMDILSDVLSEILEDRRTNESIESQVISQSLNTHALNKACSHVSNENKTNMISQEKKKCVLFSLLNNVADKSAVNRIANYILKNPLDSIGSHSNTPTSSSSVNNTIIKSTVNARNADTGTKASSYNLMASEQDFLPFISNSTNDVTLENNVSGISVNLNRMANYSFANSFEQSKVVNSHYNVLASSAVVTNAAIEQSPSNPPFTVNKSQMKLTHKPLAVVANAIQTNARNQVIPSAASYNSNQEISTNGVSSSTRPFLNVGSKQFLSSPVVLNNVPLSANPQTAISATNFSHPLVGFVTEQSHESDSVQLVNLVCDISSKNNGHQPVISTASGTQKDIISQNNNNSTPLFIKLPAVTHLIYPNSTFQQISKNKSTQGNFVNSSATNNIIPGINSQITNSAQKHKSLPLVMLRNLTNNVESMILNKPSDNIANNKVPIVIYSGQPIPLDTTIQKTGCLIYLPPLRTVANCMQNEDPLSKPQISSVLKDNSKKIHHRPLLPVSQSSNINSTENDVIDLDDSTYKIFAKSELESSVESTNSCTTHVKPLNQLNFNFTPIDNQNLNSERVCLDSAKSEINNFNIPCQNSSSVLSKQLRKLEVRQLYKVKSVHCDQQTELTVKGCHHIRKRPFPTKFYKENSMSSADSEQEYKSGHDSVVEIKMCNNNSYSLNYKNAQSDNSQDSILFPLDNKIPKVILTPLELVDVNNSISPDVKFILQFNKQIIPGNNNEHIKPHIKENSKSCYTSQIRESIYSNVSGGEKLVALESHIANKSEISDCIKITDSSGLALDQNFSSCSIKKMKTDSPEEDKNISVEKALYENTSALLHNPLTSSSDHSTNSPSQSTSILPPNVLIQLSDHSAQSVSNNNNEPQIMSVPALNNSSFNQEKTNIQSVFSVTNNNQSVYSQQAESSVIWNAANISAYSGNGQQLFCKNAHFQASVRNKKSVSIDQKRSTATPVFSVVNNVQTVSPEQMIELNEMKNSLKICNSVIVSSDNGSINNQQYKNEKYHMSPAVTTGSRSLNITKETPNIHLIFPVAHSVQTEVQGKFLMVKNGVIPSNKVSLHSQQLSSIFPPKVTQTNSSLRMIAPKNILTDGSKNINLCQSNLNISKFHKIGPTKSTNTGSASENASSISFFIQKPISNNVVINSLSHPSGISSNIDPTLYSSMFKNMNSDTDSEQSATSQQVLRNYEVDKNISTLPTNNATVSPLILRNNALILNSLITSSQQSSTQTSSTAQSESAFSLLPLVNISNYLPVDNNCQHDALNNVPDFRKDDDSLVTPNKNNQEQSSPKRKRERSESPVVFSVNLKKPKKIKIKNCLFSNSKLTSVKASSTSLMPCQDKQEKFDCSSDDSNLSVSTNGTTFLVTPSKIKNKFAFNATTAKTTDDIAYDNVEIMQPLNCQNNFIVSQPVICPSKSPNVFLVSNAAEKQNVLRNKVASFSQAIRAQISSNEINMKKNREIRSESIFVNSSHNQTACTLNDDDVVVLCEVKNSKSSRRCTASSQQIAKETIYQSPDEVFTLSTFIKSEIEVESVDKT